jgi:hypothetical protein
MVGAALAGQIGGGLPGSGVSSSSEESEEGGETPKKEGELTDEAVEGVFAEFYRKRVEWFTEPPGPGHDFKVSILGGAWAASHIGKVVDGFMAKASSVGAQAFCLQYRLHQSASFSVSLYSEGRATWFCQAWARNMQFFYDIYIASGVGNYTVQDVNVEAFEEAPEFTAMVRELLGKPLTRAKEIRALKPARPA